MLDKLQAIEERYEQLGEELLDVTINYQRAGEVNKERVDLEPLIMNCLLYTSPSPRDRTRSRMPSSA